MDNPALFPHDTFANDLDNVKYYTPFYIETLRFITNLTDGNYELEVACEKVPCKL